ncbi:MAG: type IV pilin [Nanoarchaeota archaeon]|nr:type IV pilin [Nanoarchaeota archaeon]
MNIKKKGVSPVIATILLIAIVIIIALIVFLWFRGIQEEAITKFDGTNVKLVCDDVAFDASYSNGMIYLSNTGNVPIFKIKATISVAAGSHETITIGDNDPDNWPKVGLLQMGVYSGPITVVGDSIILTPVLIGKTSEGDKAYTCGDRHAKEILTA